MMAPEGDQAAAAAAVTTSFDLAGASRSGTGSSDGRAPLKWPFTSRAQQERSLQRAAKAAQISYSSEASDASDGERWQGNGRWVHDKEADSDEEQSSRGSPRPSLDDHESAENEPDEAMPAELIQLRRWLRTDTSCSVAARRGQRQRDYRRLLPQRTERFRSYS